MNVMFTLCWGDMTDLVYEDVRHPDTVCSPTSENLLTNMANSNVIGFINENLVTNMSNSIVVGVIPRTIRPPCFFYSNQWNLFGHIQI